MSNALLAVVFFSLCAIVHALDCPAGSFGQSSCDLCPAGTYATGTGLTYIWECDDCIYGKFSDAGATTCTLCPAGKYQYAWKKSFCWDCPVGTYSTFVGATQDTTCTACAEGLYTPAQGQTICSICAAGYYTTYYHYYASVAGTLICLECERGKYNDLPFDSDTMAHDSVPLLESCHLCSAGKYAPDLGMSACTDCGITDENYRNAYTTPYVGGITCNECSGTEHAFEYYDINIAFQYTFTEEAQVHLAESACFDFSQAYLTGATTYKKLMDLVSSTTYTFYENYTDASKIAFRSTQTFEWQNAVPAQQHILLVRDKLVPQYNGWNFVLWAFRASETQTQTRLAFKGVLLDPDCSSSSTLNSCASDILDIHPFPIAVIELSENSDNYQNFHNHVCDSLYINNQAMAVTISPIIPSTLTGIPRTCQSCESGQYIGDKNIWNAQVEQTPCEPCTDCSPQQLRTHHSNSCSPDAMRSGTCSTCEAGHKFVEFADPECVACEAGKYRADFMSVASCETCPKLIHPSDCDVDCDWATRATSDAGSASCTCKDNNAKMEFEVRAGISTQVCKCKPGYYMQDPAAGTCTQSEQDFYVDEANTSPSARKACPDFSFSAAGSTSLLDCYCHETRYLQEVDETFECLCKAGMFQSNPEQAQCDLCSDNHCGVNEYLANCSDTYQGDCKSCDDTECGIGEKLINCGVGYAHLPASYGAEGDCRPEYQLVRTPLCPAQESEGATVEVPAARTALGDYDFETVFGIDYQNAPFQCRVACDGKGTADSTFCDGPFACNMKTCVQSMPARTTASQLPPVQVCPVVITADDSIIDIRAKRSTSCVSCSKCGHIKSIETSIADWGRGCCKECSRLMCEQDEIYDWTSSSCKPCSALQDVRLCSSADRAALRMDLQQVTGYLPFLRFKDCVGGSNMLDTITYGICESCAENLKKFTCTRSQYLASCEEPDVCQSCLRESLTNVQLNVVQQNWQRHGVDHALYCQITACKPRDDAQWTGILANGEMCQQACVTASDLNCADDEYFLPCILPHMSRCVKFYPRHTIFTPVLLLKDEVNLLNEYPHADFDGGERHKFASFENTVITLNNPLHEYQCVWNSRAIHDNTNNPAGVSHVFWSPQQTMSSEYADTGSKACADWPFSNLNLPDSLPLLPLQNTIALRSEETTGGFRRVAVNTEAYVLSYRFSGEFTEDIQDLTTRKLDMLQEPNAYGIGDLFLLLRLHMASCKLSIVLPSDRGLSSSSWLSNVFLVFAVTDLSMYDTHEAEIIPLQAQVDVLPSTYMHSNNFYALDDSLFLREHAIFVPEETPFVHSTWRVLFESACTDLPAEFETRDTLAAWNAKEIIKSPPPYAFVGYGRVYNVQMYILTTKHCPVSKYAYLYVLPLFADVAHRPAGDAFDPSSRPTSDVTLQAIDKVNYYFPNAINADRHFAANLQPYTQTFENSGFGLFVKQNYDRGFNIRQAHGAISPYDACAVVLSSEHHVICTGSSQTLIIYASNLTVAIPQRVLTVAYLSINDTAYVLWTQGHAHPFSAVLKMRRIGDEATGTATGTFEFTECSKWISLSVYELAHDDNQFTVLALEYHLARLQVSTYKMQVISEPDLSIALVAQNSIPVNLPNYQIIASVPYTEEDWLRYCRVVHGKHAQHALVACVQKTVSENNDVLQLHTCLLLNATSVCQQVYMTSSVAVRPSFISISFLRITDNVEKWVIACNHETFVFQYAHTSGVASLKRAMQSHLAQTHFVRVQTLFYTMTAAMPQSATNVGILTYLPAFERLSNCSSIQAQAVLVMPGASSVSEEHLVRANIQLLHNSIDPKTLQPSYLVNSYNELQTTSSDLHSFSMHVFQNTTVSIRIPQYIGILTTDGCAQECCFRTVDLNSVAESQPPYSELTLTYTIKIDTILSRQIDVVIMQAIVSCGGALAVCASFTSTSCFFDATNLCESDNQDLQVIVVLFKSEGTIHMQEFELKTGTHTRHTVISEEFAVDGEPFLHMSRHVRIVQAFTADTFSAQSVVQLFNRFDVATHKFPVERFWHRERKVVSLQGIDAPEILLQIHNQDSDTDKIFNIGVDDFEVLPCLSTLPEPIEPLSGLSGIGVGVYIPNQNELAVLGLAHLVRSTDYWSRIHVTVGLELKQEAINCEYEISITDSLNSTQALHMLGCNLTMSTTGVRESYAECQVQIQIPNSGQQSIHFVARPTSNFMDEQRCALSESALFVVYLRSHVALYECPSEMFTDKFGNCQSCHDYEQHFDVCATGYRLQGCPVFTEASADNCIQCVTTSIDILEGRAEFAPFDEQNQAPCRVQCKSDYFATYLDGDIVSCVHCSEQPEPCAVGHVWQNCTSSDDAHCAACTNLDGLGLYALNEEFIAPDSCDTQCKVGFYRDEDELCKKCWSFDEAIFNNGDGFFTFSNCTESANTQAHLCIEQTGSVILGHDFNMTGSCPRMCAAGWYPEVSNQTCQQCTTPVFVNATGFLQTSTDFVWSGPGQSCSIACMLPFISLADRQLQDYNTSQRQISALTPAHTCVLCENHCDVGYYPTGELCNCLPCTNVPDLDASNLIFGSAGQLDDEASCEIHCRAGMFRLLSTDTCQHHSQVSCDANEFMVAGTAFADAKCQACSGCDGRQLVTSCSEQNDDKCSACPNTDSAKAYFFPINFFSEKFVGNNCTRACLDGFVRDTATSACEACSHVCAAGYRFPVQRANCSHCAPCPAKPEHAVWDDSTDRNSSDCAWQCAERYELRNDACVYKRSVYDDNSSVLIRELECMPGHTLVQFQCVSCYNASHVKHSELPLIDEWQERWDWTFECHWSCYQLKGYMALQAQSKSHWECVTEAHWKRAVQQQESSTAYLEDIVAIPDSAFTHSKGELWLIIILLASIPCFILIVVVIFHKLARRHQAQKAESKVTTMHSPTDTPAVAIDVAL